MSFLDTLWPTILRASQSTGLDPRLIAAQAALESGYGQHAPGNNLFGIKGGNGPALATNEVVNGQPVQTTAQFRSYASPQDSVLGYANFINSNKRYAPVKAAQGLDAQIQAMGQSGYATDPNYAQKIGAIAHSLQPPPQAASGAINAAAPPPPAAPSVSPPASPMVASAGIPASVASYATSDDNAKSPLQRLGDALMRFPSGPQAQTRMPGPSATNGDALLKYMANPHALTDFLLKKRLGLG